LRTKPTPNPFRSSPSLSWGKDQNFRSVSATS